MDKSKILQKNNLLIIIIASILIIGAIIGTVVYLKNDKNALANVDEGNNPISGNQVEGTDDGNTSSNNNVEGINNDGNTTDNNQSNNLNNNVDEVNQVTQNNTSSQNDENNGTQSNNNYNNVNNGNVNNSAVGNNENATNTYTSNQNVPNQEYTQTVSQTTTKVTEEPWYTKIIGWVPKTVGLNIDNVDINKVNIVAKKVAIVNDNLDINTVLDGDIITYKILVKNIGKIDAEAIYIEDYVPEGTGLVEDSIDNDGKISEDGKILWKKDLKIDEEIAVLYKVKAIKNDEISQIDNTAIVNGEKTNTTHNPKIYFNKEVKVISEDGKELNNQIVMPGTRLRYYINITNNSEYDGTTNVEDDIPEGTTLYNNIISNEGTIEQNKIVWENLKIPAKSSVKLYFDVTVNKNQKETVENVAKIGTKREDSNDEERYTNTVKTPVFMASKESEKDYNETLKTPKLHETNEVTYVVTIKNSANTNNGEELEGTAVLEDLFWKEDLNKMTFKNATLVVKNKNGEEKLNEPKEESFLKNINVTLKQGETATLIYTYVIDEMENPNITVKGQNKIEWDEISNNLYWAESIGNMPSRPENENDQTSYKNIENENDPTPATQDPANSEKQGLIDTVIVHVEEENINIEAIKIWQDFNNEYEKRPDEVVFNLFRDGIFAGKSLKPSKENDWKVVFDNLRKTGVNGNDFVYSIIEDFIPFYKTPDAGYTNGENNKITITNYLDQLFIAEKKSSKEGQTVKENEDIDYTITVYNIGEEDGVISILDSYRDNDFNKLTFKSGSIEYYNNSSDEQPVTTENITEDYLKNKITLNIKGNGKVVIKYICSVNPIDEEKNPDEDGIIREQIINDLYWAKTNAEDPDDNRYKTDTPIDTVTVKCEKEYTNITASKIWDDESNTSNRPEKIKFILQKNGVDTNISKELSSANAVANNSNIWQITFEKLIKNDQNGRKYNYTIREESVEHYIAKYSDDKLTVTNSIGEDIEAKVITTNSNNPTVPMDVVFVLDVSSSMLDDPINAGLTGPGRTNKVDTAKAITMVESVNKAIDEVIKNNPENRIAVQLYNSKVESQNSDYYLIELGKYTRNANGKYINFNWSEQGNSTYASVKRFDGILTTTVNSKVGKVTEAKSYDEESIIGTYTQAGIQKGEAILTGASNKMISGTDYTRIPVMVLVTDGDPTHYNPTSAGTSTIIPSDDAAKTTYPTVGSRIAKEKFTSAEYYYYTMKQLEASKNTISDAYSNNSSIERTCRLYTIGIGMQGSMAEVLLNPTSSYIQNNLVDSENINPNINNNGNNYGYNNSSQKNSRFYTEQQGRLKSMLLGENGFAGISENYADKSFNIKNSSDTTLLNQLENAFLEVIKDSQKDSQENIETFSIGESRKLELTDINVNRKFTIKINGTDYDNNTITLEKSYETFTQSLSDATVNSYIKGSYYIDLSILKAGNIEVSYFKNN